MNESVEKKQVSGKWVVAIVLAISLVIALIRYIYIPKTNPREADPGNPFYSPPPRDAQQEK
jgi:hypothetical protein